MHRIFRVKAYEQEHGPHFDEVMAHKAVSKMENEDGSRGPHWSIEETTAEEISQGNRYFIYYNKCDGIFQTVNHIVPPTATPSES